MKLYWQVVKMVWQKAVLRRNTGAVVRDFAEEMGIVYIKLAQMLATQNYGRIFTEEDRAELASICDDCNPLDYKEVEEILRVEFGDLEAVFREIEHEPIGAASVSQVHWAILRDGTEVAIKVKRRDVAQTIEREIARIRKLMRRFGKVLRFGNLTGGDRALELYLEWIRQETDFRHEVENLKLYGEFAEEVNGKIAGAKRIRVPRVYEEYCTENVIVMEFVRAKTINRLEMTEVKKERVREALNDYLRLSFWAMFHDRQIVFHGDPHGGNVCVDEAGEIWFLDMGLLSVISDEDAKLCRALFLAAYTGNAGKMYDLLVNYGGTNEEKRGNFRQRCEEFCRGVRGKDVTYYFVDMINICLDYEFVPPDFLFSMAKAFICLNGINKMAENRISAQELLQEQAVEFVLRRSLGDCREVLVGGLKIGPEMLIDSVSGDPVRALARVVTRSEMREKLADAAANFREMLELCG